MADYFDIADNGVEAYGTAIEGSPAPATVSIADLNGLLGPAGVQTTSLSVYVRNLRIRRIGSTVRIAWKGQDGIARSQWWGGAVLEHGIAYGDEAVAIAPSGKIVWISSQTEWHIEGEPSARLLPPERTGTSQGILDFTPEGDVIWTDAARRIHRVGPVDFVTSLTRGPWTFGTCSGGTGIAAVNTDTGVALMAPAPIPTPWTVRGEVVNGELILAVSLPGQALHERDLVPWQPYVDLDPPAFVPSLTTPNHRVTLSVCGAPGFNLNTAAPMNDDFSIEPWGSFVTLGGRYEVEELARASMLPHKPVFLYTDSPDYSTSDLGEVLGSQSFDTPVPTLQVYPPHSSLREPLDQRKLRILRSLTAVKGAAPGRPLALYLALYRQVHPVLGYSWSVEDTLELFRWGWDLAARDSQIRWVHVFHQSRAAGKDGVVSRPEFKQILEEARKRAATWTPLPPPVPLPVPPGAHRILPMATPLKVGLKLVGYGVLSSEPGQEGIEFRDVPKATAWQKVLVEAPDAAAPHRYRVTFEASGRVFAHNPAGYLETRPAGTFGPWEQLVGGTLPDGRRVLFPADAVGRAATTIFELIEAEA